MPKVVPDDVQDYATSYTKQAWEDEFIDHLKAEGGVISKAAQLAGISTQMVYAYRKRFASFDAKVKYAILDGLSRVETKVFENALENDKLARWLLGRRNPEEYGAMRERECQVCKQRELNEQHEDTAWMQDFSQEDLEKYFQLESKKQASIQLRRQQETADLHKALLEGE